MNVYIAYGGSADQVTALRLQALGAVNGLRVFVPPAHTRHIRPVVLNQQMVSELRDSDVVLGVVGTGLSEACRLELQVALGLEKTTIIIAEPPFEPSLEPQFLRNLVLIDPADPAQAENGIVQQLRQTNLEQDMRQPILALCTLALGLLLFASQD